jgi:Transcriptional regulator
MTDKYHHGNLKTALIEAGINLINEYGDSGLSLRKTASRCGVSQAAPYAHFKNKEDLIAAMQEYVTDQFMKVLQEAVEGKENFPEESLICLGIAYVNFFIDHPNYYKFMFFTPYMQINLTTELCEDAFPPYALFQKITFNCFEKIGCPEKSRLVCLANTWATVHGIAMLATQENVKYEGDWKKDIRRILTNDRD